MVKTKFSERAKHRLCIVAGLLRSEGVDLNCPREQFYDQILETLLGLSPERQTMLKALVGWVEAYARASIDPVNQLVEGHSAGPKKFRG